MPLAKIKPVSGEEAKPKKRGGGGSNSSSASTGPGSSAGKKIKSSAKLTVLREMDDDYVSPPVQNVILHLKCSMEDLKNYNNVFKTTFKNSTFEYNPEIPPEIKTYNEDALASNFVPFERADNSAMVSAYSGICSVCRSAGETAPAQPTASEVADPKEDAAIQAKMRGIKISLYTGEVDKHSACFWCTCEYDNRPFFIPRNEVAGQMMVYGSFCTPECAVAFLFRERLDDTTKFERYHLLNKLYGGGTSAGGGENIRPAPNPHYLLDKFMGKLTIQEYRRLLKTQHNLVLMEKPMTRVFPELHTETEGGGGVSYKIKMAGDK